MPGFALLRANELSILRDCRHDSRIIDMIMTFLFLYIFSFYGLAAVFRRLHQKQSSLDMSRLGSYWMAGRHESWFAQFLNQEDIASGVHCGLVGERKLYASSEWDLCAHETGERAPQAENWSTFAAIIG